MSVCTSLITFLCWCFLLFTCLFSSIPYIVLIWCTLSLIGTETRLRYVDTSATCGGYITGTAKRPIWAVTYNTRSLLRTRRTGHLRIGWYEVTSYSSMTQWILAPSHGGSSTPLLKDAVIFKFNMKFGANTVWRTMDLTGGAQVILVNVCFYDDHVLR